METGRRTHFVGRVLRRRLRFCLLHHQRQALEEDLVGRPSVHRESLVGPPEQLGQWTSTPVIGAMGGVARRRVKSRRAEMASVLRGRARDGSKKAPAIVPPQDRSS